MRNISHPEGIYRCNAQDCVRSLRSSDSSRTKRQVNAFILCRDTFIPLTFSPILAQESRLKQLPMPRHGVSECGIGCKGNEKSDYSRIFSWLFFVVRIKIEVWAHKEDLLRPISFQSPWLRLPHDKPYHHFKYDAKCRETVSRRFPLGSAVSKSAEPSDHTR